MIYKKYEFPNQELLNEKVEALYNSNEHIPLNKLQIEKGIYEGEEIVKEPILSAGWCVDVVWKTEVSEDWNEYEMHPKNPKHTLL